MIVADYLQERLCPLCSSQSQEELCSLSMAKIFQVNPTYNEAWFNEKSISPNFEFPIVECQDCNFVFSKFELKDEMAFRYYNEGIDAQKSKEKIFKKQKRISFIDIWQRLNLLSEKQGLVKVLDFGAGWGDFLAIAKSPGVEVFGLEFDERKVTFAQSQGVPTGNMEFIKENAPYDIFMCNQVLEHLKQPQEALQTLRSILSNDAVGFIAVPNFSEPIMRQQLALLKDGSLAKKDIDPLGHLNYFTPQNLRKIVLNAGFKEVTSDSAPNSNKGIFSSVYRHFKEKSSAKPSTSMYVKAV